MNMDSWGLYSVTSSAVVHDDDVTGPFEVFLCVLRLPPAKFEANRTTVYYPGKLVSFFMFFIVLIKLFGASLPISFMNLTTARRDNFVKYYLLGALGRSVRTETGAPSHQYILSVGIPRYRLKS